MKKIGLIILFLVSIDFNSKAQSTRYFEFSTNCGHGNWQDTTFIASTSNKALIDTVLANLARPFGQRKFISGDIDYGSGEHNHNASHWFSWHFIPNKWDLVEVAIELCDGCPYTDVNADTAYWIGNIGHYCPWSSKPVREVSKPLGINEYNFSNTIVLYPNPAKDRLGLKWDGLNDISITIYNSMGQELSTTTSTHQNNIIDLSELEIGLYFLRIRHQNNYLFKKVIVEGR